jgi:cytochrome c-type biogenesis protein CcmH/NrfG
MTVVILCAILTAAAVSWVVHPLMKNKDTRRMGLAIVCIVAPGAILTYLMIGHPDIPSQAALFETTGPRTAARALTGKELSLMQQVAADPDNVKLMVALGDVRLKAGRWEDALAILDTAHGKTPADRDVNLELGAAHDEAAAVLLNRDNDRAGAVDQLQQARAIAPKDAPYLPQVERDIQLLETVP